MPSSVNASLQAFKFAHFFSPLLADCACGHQMVSVVAIAQLVHICHLPHMLTHAPTCSCMDNCAHCAVAADFEAKPSVLLLGQYRQVGRQRSELFKGARFSVSVLRQTKINKQTCHSPRLPQLPLNQCPSSQSTNSSSTNSTANISKLVSKKPDLFQPSHKDECFKNYNKDGSQPPAGRSLNIIARPRSQSVNSGRSAIASSRCLKLAIWSQPSAAIQMVQAGPIGYPHHNASLRH